MKTTYVIQHYQKQVRKGVEQARRAKSATVKQTSEGAEGRSTPVQKTHGRLRKKQRVWTLNRSPHGNKTAREQFGRQIWQRKRENVDPAVRKGVRQSEGGKVKRKETHVVRS